MKVLIVEDEIINIIILKSILETEQVTDIVEVKNGLEAVEICKENNFDIIFMDIRMPIMDGIQATKVIKQIKTANIVAYTAYSQEYDPSFNEIFDGFLSKPFNIKQLKEVLKREHISV